MLFRVGSVYKICQIRYRSRLTAFKTCSRKILPCKTAFLGKHRTGCAPTACSTSSSVKCGGHKEISWKCILMLNMPIFISFTASATEMLQLLRGSIS
jgi:hypothetical protein